MTPTCRTTAIVLGVLTLDACSGPGAIATPLPRVDPASPEGAPIARGGLEVRDPGGCEATARSARIQAELAALGAGHPWAGSYFEGDGLGTNVFLCLAPEAGFVFEWYGCGGLYDRNYGTVHECDGALELAFELPNARGSFRGFGERFVPVAWGSRHYLIEPDDFTSFANDVNAQWEPREGASGSFLLRRGDERVPVSGKPAVPARFAPQFLEAPLEAHVVAVGRSSIERRREIDTRVTTVTLDVGAEDGAFVGMDLFVGDVPSAEKLTLTALEPTRSTAECADYGADGPVPEVGWTLRTRY